MTLEAAKPDTQDLVSTEFLPPAPGIPAHDAPSAAALALMENGDTELMRAPILGSPEDDSPPVTRTLPDSVPACARIAVSDGTAIDLVGFDLVGTVRIGRAPSPGGPGGDEPLLVTVPSPHQDISRSHIQLVTVAGQVVATDLDSTNGTILIRPGGEVERERLHAGEAVTVPVGSLLELGDGISVRIESPHHVAPGPSPRRSSP